MDILLLKTREGYVKADAVEGPYSLTLDRAEATQFSERACYDFLSRHPEIIYFQQVRAGDSDRIHFIKTH